MKKQTLLVAVMSALAAGAMVGGATIALAQADVIKQRQDNRKETAATMRSIKGVIDAKGDVKTQAFAAGAIAAWARALPGLFPAGSDGGTTKALPTVWSDRAGFEKAAATLATEAGKLADLAKTGDQAAFATQWGVVRGACSACHDKYRVADKPKG